MERPVNRVEGEFPLGGQLPSPCLAERRVRRDDDLSEELVRRRTGIPQGKGDDIRRRVDAHEVPMELPHAGIPDDGDAYDPFRAMVPEHVEDGATERRPVEAQAPLEPHEEGARLSPRTPLRALHSREET